MDDSVLKMMSDMQALIDAAKERDRLLLVVKELSNQNTSLKVAANKLMASVNDAILDLTVSTSLMKNFSLSDSMEPYDDCDYNHSDGECCTNCDDNKFKDEVATEAPRPEESQAGTYEADDDHDCCDDDDCYDDDCYDDDCHDDDDDDCCDGKTLITAQTEGLIHGCEI